MGTPILEFKTSVKDLGLEAFRAKYPHPFLVLSGTEIVVDSKRPFQTIGPGEEGSPSHALEVFAVYRNGAPPSAMITIGRTKNNDIQIDSPSVSKLHAFLRQVSTDEFSLTDTGSRNGTLLNGKPLQPKVTVPINDRDVVTFANRFVGTFYLAKTLYEMLPQLKPR